MRKLTIAIALTGAMAVTVTTAAAQADTFLSKTDAKRATRQVVRDRYGEDIIGSVYAFCKPQGETYDPNYSYRIWSCGWLAESAYRGEKYCGGRLRITGRGGHGNFYYRITMGENCD